MHFGEGNTLDVAEGTKLIQLGTSAHGDGQESTRNTAEYAAWRQLTALLPAHLNPQILLLLQANQGAELIRQLSPVAQGDSFYRES